MDDFFTENSRYGKTTKKEDEVKPMKQNGSGVIEQKLRTRSPQDPRQGYSLH